MGVHMHPLSALGPPLSMSALSLGNRQACRWSTGVHPEKCRWHFWVHHWHFRSQSLALPRLARLHHQQPRCPLWVVAMPPQEACIAHANQQGDP